MKYAVVRIKGHQYKVKEGEEILVDKLKDKKPAPEVLLMVNDKKISVGKPLVKDAKVELKVLGEERGQKVIIRKFKAKSRYRRKRGFRATYSRLQVGKIS